MNLFSNKNNVITYTVNKVSTNNLYISISHNMGSASRSGMSPLYDENGNIAKYQK